MSFKFYAILFFCFSLIFCANAQKSDSLGGPAYQQKYQLPIRKALEPIKIDGDLTDAAWRGAAIAKDFAPHWPQDNVPLARQTEVKMTFDERFLYVSAVCFDSSYHIVQTLKRDTRFWDSDAFSVVIDPINQRTNGFLFGVGPTNVQYEDLVTSDNFGDLNWSWDNRWYSATKIFKDHWTVEMAIPFKTLRFDPAKKTWGINFIRNDVKNNQYDTWTFIPVNFNGYDLGWTGGLSWQETPPSVKGNVSIIPYVTGGANHSHLEREPTTSNYNGGLDAKVSITPSMNLDLTINPDFSQVEVDRQVTNLTRFNIFFPERRTFFLENDDLFSTYGAPPFRPFFSRTIGLDANAQPMPILGGARLTGNLSKTLRVGLLNMQTRANDASPAQNFTAFSFNQRVLKRSLVKGYVLNKESFMSADEQKQNPLQRYGRNQGLEFSYSNQQGTINAWTGYHLSQKPTIKGQSAMAQVGVGYFGRKVNFFVDLANIGTNYYADMGFINRIENFTFVTDPRTGRALRDTVARLGFSQIYSEGSYTFRPINKKVNTHGFETSNFFVWNPNGTLGERLSTLAYSVQFQNTVELSLQIDDNDVRALFPFGFTDSAFPLPVGQYRYRQVNAAYNSDYRKKFIFSGGVRAGGFYNGTLRQFTAEVTYRAQPWGNFTMAFEQNDIKLPEPYGSDRLLLVSPRIEINFSTSVFWTTFLQFNTQRNNFNVNSRLQWRFKPMSDFFLVYTDNYFTDPLFRNKNRGIVFKLNYWLTL